MRSILVPVDGSTFAEHALPYALGIARRSSARLHLALVHVPSEGLSADPGLRSADAAWHPGRQEQDVAYLGQLVDRLDAADLTLRPALLHGHVPSALARYVEEKAIDGVVMTTHGRGGLQRAWLGSTADALIRHCTVPLLLIRPSGSTGQVDARSDRVVGRVVAALDGSRIAEAALRDALSLGITRDATVVLAHILQPPVAAASPYLPHTIQLTHEEMAARQAAMQRYLDRVAALAWLAGRDVRTRVLTDFHPAPAVLDLAATTGADLITLGTHGRGGLRRMILGSVADKIIRGTSRPVLVRRGVAGLARLEFGPSERDTSPETGVPSGA